MESFFLEPVQHLPGFVRLDALHGGEQCGLTQAFLEDTCLVQQVIRNYRIVHPHASLIEHSEDGFSLAKTARKLPALKFLFVRNSEVFKFVNVALVMRYRAGAEP